MKILVTQVLKNYAGEDIKDAKEELYTFRDAVAIACNNAAQGETLPAEVKNKLFQITLKLYKESEPDFTVDQLALIKERSDKIHTPLIAGRIGEILEGIAPVEAVDKSE